VPLYEYRCADCDTVFEQRRTMADADAGVRCPTGHTRVKRLLSVFASSRSGGAGPAPAAGPVAGGAPCGAACGCH
jgi:putative FmdB family regulatory protein